MADSFFGFNTSSRVLEGEILDLEEEEEYDALNDETFNTDGDLEEDWEESHKILAAVEETTRHKDLTNKNDDALNFDVETSLNKLVLNDDESRPSVSGTISNNLDFGSWSTGPGTLPPPPNLSEQELLFLQKPMQSSMFLPPQLQKIPTVAELESKLIEASQKNAASKPINPPPGLAPPTRPPLVQNPPKLPGFPSFDSPFQPWAGKGPPQAMGNRLPVYPQELMMMRNPAEKLTMPGVPFMPPPLGFPMINPQLVPPPHNFVRMMSPSIRGFYPIHNPAGQLRHDNFMTQRNFPPPHPILQQNHHLWQQNQQQINFMQQHHRTRRNSEHDEYARLMSNRERIWLLNLQILQMSSGKPFIDDYYYTVWKSRQNKKELEQRNGIVKNVVKVNRKESNGRERKDSEKEFSPRVYVPQQFENSLGKLQCGSVTAPRMVIDMDVVNSEPQNGSTTPQPHKDQKKTKKILLELERLYLLLIQAEEATHGVESERPEAEAEPMEPPMLIINKIINSYLQDDRFSSFLSVRKGKNLLLRCLSLIEDLNTTLIRDLWSRFIKAFNMINKRDLSDNLLPKFYPYFKKWIDECCWSDFIVVAACLQNCIRDGRTSARVHSPSPSKPVLFHLILTKLGISIVSQILKRGEEMVGQLNSMESDTWTNLTQDIIKNLANLNNTDTIPKPIDAIPHNTLSSLENSRLKGLNPSCHSTLHALFTS